MKDIFRLIRCIFKSKNRNNHLYKSTKKINNKKFYSTKNRWIYPESDNTDVFGKKKYFKLTKPEMSLKNKWLHPEDEFGEMENGVSD
jgi:hypothetical protein